MTFYKYMAVTFANTNYGISHTGTGPEYGTTQAAWKGVLTEAERVADLHIEVKDKLLNDVQTSIKQWRGENYTKPMMGHCKQTKELEDGFRKVQ